MHFGSCEEQLLRAESSRFRPRQQRQTMRRHLTPILTSFCCLAFIATAASQDAQAPVNAGKAIHVATALNHLTVLEFQEPVTLVAAGGLEFQIERQDNKVFVKPLKSGVSTNLFVWTASRRFSYELEPPGEVKNMNFAIDNAVAAAKPAIDPQAQLDQLADMMFTRAFLGSEAIDSAGIPVPKNRVAVRIEQVFRTKNSLYVHYSIENRSKNPYHVIAPQAYQWQVSRPAISLPGLYGRQLDEQTVRKLRDTKKVALPIGHAEAKPEDLSSGQISNGVIAIRQDLNSPTVVQLVFDVGIEAVVVL